MSDRVQARVKQLSNAQKKTKERFQILVDCVAVDGFSRAELTEFYVKNSQHHLQLYQEYIASADAEAAKGRLLSVQEAVRAAGVFQELVRTGDTTIVRTEWAEREAFALIHQENHVAVRRAGLEAFCTYVGCRYAATGTPCPKLLLDAIVSAIDWDCLRGSHSCAITLPPNIGEVRRSRHDSFPPRARQSSSSDDERNAEVTKTIHWITSGVFNDNSSEAAATFWFNFFCNFVAPVLFPVGCFRCGILSERSLHGFQTPHRLVLPLLVEMVELLSKNPQQHQWTFGSSQKAEKLGLLILTEVIANPSHILAPSSLRALTTFVHLIMNPTTHFGAVAEEILGDALENGNVGVCVALLLPPADDLSLPIGIYQSVVEAYAELLLVVVQCESPVLRFTDGFRARCVEAIASICTELTRLSVSRPSPIVEEPLPYVVQAFWVAAALACPIFSAEFGEKFVPMVHDLEVAVASSGSAVPYLTRCWTMQVVWLFRVMAAPASAKSVPLNWPLPSVSKSSPGPELNTYRFSRQQASAYVVARTFQQRTSSEEQLFFVASEALHNLLYNVDADAPVTQDRKGSALCESMRLLCDANRHGTIAANPNTLLKLVAPYLLILSALRKPNGLLTDGAVEALEAMGDCLSMQPPLAEALDRRLFTVVADRLHQTLTCCLRTPEGNAEVFCRVMVALFRSNTSTVAGRPTSSFFTVTHQGALVLLECLADCAMRVLQSPDNSRVPHNVAVDAKTAVLGFFQWYVVIPSALSLLVLRDK